MNQWVSTPRYVNKGKMVHSGLSELKWRAIENNVKSGFLAGSDSKRRRVSEGEYPKPHVWKCFQGRNRVSRQVLLPGFQTYHPIHRSPKLPYGRHCGCPRWLALLVLVSTLARFWKRKKEEEKKKRKVFSRNRGYVKQYGLTNVILILPLQAGLDVVVLVHEVEEPL